MGRLRYLFTFSFYCFFVGGLYAQQAENPSKFSFTLDTHWIRIGEQFKGKIQLMTARKAAIDFPVIDSLLPKGVILVKKSVIDTAFTSSQKKISQFAVLTAFEPGAYLFRSVKAISNDEILYTKPLSVIVDNVEVDTAKQKMYGIVDNVPIPYTFWEFVSDYYIHFLIILIIAFMLYRMRRYRRKIKRKDFQIPTIPPYEWATQEMDKLAGLGYDFSTKEDSKLFYARLTEILRTYFERTFDISVMEATSDEFLSDMQNVPFLRKDKDLLRKVETFISRSDLIKFAKKPTNPFEAEGDLGIVRFFVEQVYHHKQENEIQNEGQEDKETIIEK